MATVHGVYGRCKSELRIIRRQLAAVESRLDESVEFPPAGGRALEVPGLAVELSRLYISLHELQRRLNTLTAQGGPSCSAVITADSTVKPQPSPTKIPKDFSHLF